MTHHVSSVWKACSLIRPRKSRSLHEQRFIWNKQRRRMRSTMLQIAHARSNAAAHHIHTTITPPGAYHNCEDMCARIKCLFTLLYGFAIFVVRWHCARARAGGYLDSFKHSYILDWLREIGNEHEHQDPSVPKEFPTLPTRCSERLVCVSLSSVIRVRTWLTCYKFSKNAKVRRKRGLL